MHAIDLLPMKCHRALCAVMLPIASGALPSDDAVTRAAYCLEVDVTSFDVLLPAQKASISRPRPAVAVPPDIITVSAGG